MLGAVLKLLCGWSRIADDRVGLRQVLELTAAADGRRYDLKTIGRALARLAAEDLIVYQPAQGRGRRAFIGLHTQFLDGIGTLARDRDGYVITDHSTGPDSEFVTFSRPRPYITQPSNPPTPQEPEASLPTRPTAVESSPQELAAVLGSLPEPLAKLPRHLRWMLGREIRMRLRAGWRAEQILEALGAPMPAGVHHPWRLALWRLRHNVIGAGPRLRPLQRVWDHQCQRQANNAADQMIAQWYGQVSAVTTARRRAELLRAHEVKFSQPAADPVAALAGAGRRAARLFPELALSEGLARWSNEVLGAATSAVKPATAGTGGSIGAGLSMELAIGGCQCIVCGSSRATARPQLPLKSMVCERCWPDIEAELGGAETVGACAAAGEGAAA